VFLAKLVASDGIEPPTPAFSGPPSKRTRNRPGDMLKSALGLSAFTLEQCWFHCGSLRWPSGFAKDQSFKGPCAASSIAGRIHASLEREGRLFGARRLGVCFLSTEGKQPRVANMLVEDYLRPAAAKAGILSSHRDDRGRLVEDDPRRFGFHNLRHSLASFLVRIRTDPKTVQTLLRHTDVKLTLQFYSHAVSQASVAR
jgi:hypothetical protein